jgi:lipid-A-disaccharide synthase
MLIAGEASGDRIAARAIRAAKVLTHERDEQLLFSGICGDESMREGMECLYHAREMSVVGFVEVARRFRFFRNVLRDMEARLKDPKTRPESLVLIDYPGFNIRLAKIAKRLGIRVVYYVSPQVWAWHKERVHELKKVVDEMLVIFPFEEKIYHDAGLKQAHFIGHPLVEMIDEEKQSFLSRKAFAKKHALDPSKEWLLIFSGSRNEEVRRHLAILSDAALELSKTHNFLPILVEAATISEQTYAEYLGSRTVKRFRAPATSHELMYHSTLGLLKSGTTTLEAALLGLPGIICYRTHPLTFAIGKRLVKLAFIGLANIVLGRKLYPELLQNDCTVSRIVTSAEEVLATSAVFREGLLNVDRTLRAGSTPPSVLAAKAILQL